MAFSKNVNRLILFCLLLSLAVNVVVGSPHKRHGRQRQSVVAASSSDKDDLQATVAALKKLVDNGALLAGNKGSKHTRHGSADGGKASSKGQDESEDSDDYEDDDYDYEDDDTESDEYYYDDTDDEDSDDYYEDEDYEDEDADDEEEEETNDTKDIDDNLSKLKIPEGQQKKPSDHHRKQIQPMKITSKKQVKKEVTKAMSTTQMTTTKPFTTLSTTKLSTTATPTSTPHTSSKASGTSSLSNRTSQTTPKNGNEDKGVKGVKKHKVVKKINVKKHAKNPRTLKTKENRRTLKAKNHPRTWKAKHAITTRHHKPPQGKKERQTKKMLATILKKLKQAKEARQRETSNGMNRKKQQGTSIKNFISRGIVTSGSSSSGQGAAGKQGDPKHKLKLQLFIDGKPVGTTGNVNIPEVAKPTKCKHPALISSTPRVFFTFMGRHRYKLGHQGLIGHEGYRMRQLNSVQGRNTKRALEIQFPKETLIHAVIMQPLHQHGRRHGDLMVTDFTIALPSVDKHKWFSVQTGGNAQVYTFKRSGKKGILVARFASPVRTRALRILPQQWQGAPYFHIGFLGCTLPH